MEISLKARKKMTSSKLQLLNDSFYFVTEKCNGDKKIVKATKIVVIQTDTVVV